MGKFEVWYEVTFWLFRDGLGCPVVAIVSRKAISGCIIQI